MGFLEGLFGFKGRLNRARYAANLLIYLLLILFLAEVEPDVRPPGDAGQLLSLAFIALTSWMFLATLAKRFHDIDRSGWWSTLVFVPLIGQLAVLVLFFYPGTPSANDSGPPG